MNEGTSSTISLFLAEALDGKEAFDDFHYDFHNDFHYDIFDDFHEDFCDSFRDDFS